jgi:hypothetical protein
MLVISVFHKLRLALTENKGPANNSDCVITGLDKVVTHDPEINLI